MEAALARLRAAPTAPITAAALAVLVYAAAHDDRPSIWRPASLILVGLLAVAAAALPPAWRAVPSPVRLALLALAAFTAWSFIAIAWADSRGDAWDGANRTLAYLVLFALFALWPPRDRVAAALLGLWTVAMTVIGLVVVVKLSTSNHPAGLLVGNRLAAPIRYQNASADSYLIALWPAVVLAAHREVAWPARAGFGAAAVILAAASLLSQSRGGVIATGVCLVLLFVVAVERRRTWLVAVPLVVAIGAIAPVLIHAGNRFGDGHPHALHGVVWPVLAAALAAAVAVGALAFAEARWRPTRETRARVRTALGRVAIGSAVLVVAAALVAAGNPAHRARSAWHSFKNGYGTNTGDSHLGSGLGSNRYDFYRVAWGQFRRAPLTGAGTDQFFQDYLARGHSDETPHYPHSIELRALGELGIVGAILMLAFLVAAGWAVARARRGPPTAAAVAVGATMAFAVWFVHGSADWFFEIFALGAPAFALLGLACGMAPRKDDRMQDLTPSGWLVLAGGGLVALAAAGSFALPWIAARDVDRAATGWPADPAAAYRRLNTAADLNPLSDEAQTTAGTIALRQGDTAHAAREFSAALKRDARDQYATLELGAIAASRGDFATAVPLLARAHALYPRDQIAAGALAQARKHRRVDLNALNDAVDRRGVQ